MLHDNDNLVEAQIYNPDAQTCTPTQLDNAITAILGRKTRTRDITGPTEFEKIVDHRFQTCRRVLLEKNEEYSRNGDRLHNFRSAGRCRGKHALEALEGMEIKHTISIDDMVRDILEGTPPTVKAIEEKFTDAINYLLLKEALIRENL